MLACNMLDAPSKLGNVVKLVRNVHLADVVAPDSFKIHWCMIYCARYRMISVVERVEVMVT